MVMHSFTVSRLAAVLVLASAIVTPQLANAITQPVSFNVLNASATLPTPFAAGDNLRLNTLVTSEVGALLQSITFTVASGVDSLTGQAAWEISTATGTGPRLIGVNLDIFDAGNALVTSDSFAGTLGGFAVSTFASGIGPGTYRLVASGTGVRDSSLDVTLSFGTTTVVPAPATWALLLTGVGALGLRARKRLTATT
jgi:hypothetical protein